VEKNGVSVVIPTYRGKYLRNCILSLSVQTCRNFEIILVENGFHDHNFHEWLSNTKLNLDIDPVYVPQLGLNRARNIGCEASKFSIVALIDDDCVAEPNWVEQILLAHCRYPNAGAIGGQIKLAMETKTPSWLISPFRPFLSEYHRGEFDTKLQRDDAPYGANLSFKKALHNKIVRFDESIGMHGRQEPQLCNDEAEFCRQLAAKENLSNYYCPRVIVYHRIPASRLNPQYFEQRMYGQGRSDIRCYFQDSLFDSRQDGFPTKFIGGGTQFPEYLERNRGTIKSPRDQSKYAHYLVRCMLANLCGQVSEFVSLQPNNFRFDSRGRDEYKSGRAAYRDKTLKELAESESLVSYFAEQLRMVMGIPGKDKIRKDDSYLATMISLLSFLNGTLDEALRRSPPQFRKFAWL